MWTDAGKPTVSDADSSKVDWVDSAMREYEGRLTRYAAQITGDLDRARDVVQDTFVKLCAEEPARLNGRLVEWLFTVCRNRALDVRRKESRVIQLTDTEMESCQSHEASPSLAAEKRESAGQISRLLADLPPNQREVIRLKFQNGLSYQEISRITNLTVTNVGFLIHTGIKTLRRHFNKESAQVPNNSRSNV